MSKHIETTSGGALRVNLPHIAILPATEEYKFRIRISRSDQLKVVGGQTLLFHAREMQFC